jgi:hypothetical protein
MRRPTRAPRPPPRPDRRRWSSPRQISARVLEALERAPVCPLPSDTTIGPPGSTATLSTLVLLWNDPHVTTLVIAMSADAALDSLRLRPDPLG